MLMTVIAATFAATCQGWSCCFGPDKHDENKNSNIMTAYEINRRCSKNTNGSNNKSETIGYKQLQYTNKKVNKKEYCCSAVI